MTFNSGATLGQNDIETPDYEIEAKITSKQSYRISVAEWGKLLDRCDTNKLPIQIVEFEDPPLSLAIIDLDDLKNLIGL